MLSEQSKFFTFLLVMCGGILLYALASESATMTYSGNATSTEKKRVELLAASSSAPKIPEFIVTHLATPEPLRGVYMTSCIASGKKLRESLIKLLDTTEMNALIIDIKDFSGKISFDVDDSRFAVNTNGCAISDIKEFIGELHKKNIYVIGRVTVMQDSVFPKSYPDAAVKKRDGSIWKDKKGLMFIDPGATEYWEYMVDLGKASHAVGFDEINYDYIRFPSDGDMTDIVFTRTGSTTKANMMKKFYEYLGREMRKAGIVTSADLFGMTTTNSDDLGIGQVLEDALENFDYVAPMVYPSHYPPMFNGWKNPNLVPYEIIKFSMTKAVERAHALERKESGYDDIPKLAETSTGTSTAMSGSTTPARAPFIPTGKYANKLRPWIQDFDYGKEYTEVDVRAQKKAVYDSMLSSWMSWDPSNKYTPSAYDKIE